MNWDPRPKKFRKTTQQELNNFASSIQMLNETYNEKTPNYAAIVRIVYEDYLVSDERKKFLKAKVLEFHGTLRDSLKTMTDSHGLSTEVAIHVSDTFQQGDSDEWHRYVF